MIGLLQRVTQASVRVGGAEVGAIQRGLLVLVGVEKEDDEAKADRLLERLLTYRVFPDAEDKMNLSLQDLADAGEEVGLLLVSQFTLAADTRKGRRPSFSSAASPDKGEALFDYLLVKANKSFPHVAAGRFGADMQVSLINDGPVTFWLQVD